MKILTSDQIRQADIYTIKHEPVSSLELMERAATVATHKIIQLAEKRNCFSVFCGNGNNGGDGFVIARQLLQNGFTVKVYFIRSHKQSPENAENFARFKKLKHAVFYEISGPEFLLPGSDEIIIDCIFGTGLSKPANGIYKSVIGTINKTGCSVISIDIPSGLYCDISSQNNAVVKAEHTLTFQTLKPCFLFAENADYIGRVHILDIGLSKKFINSVNPFGNTIENDFVKGIIKPRKLFSHKGNYGHAAIVAGSYGKTGAALLATRACLRSGAGLTTAVVPKSCYSIIQSAAPEAMTVCTDKENILWGDAEVKKYSAIGCGPGMGKEKATAAFLKKLLDKIKDPCVMDADALNILSENKSWLGSLPVNTILTPHPKEFERLAGKTKNDFDRHTLQRNFSKKYNVIVVLKGKYSCITTPGGNVYFNTTGNSGMAKGGSGDALLGLITGLLAQGYAPFESAAAGIYIHGLAGDFAASEKGMYAMLASDLIENCGKAFSAVIQNTLSSVQKNSSPLLQDWV